MLDDKYLTEKEMSEESLNKLTKSELIQRLTALNKLRIELAENLDEVQCSAKTHVETNNKLMAELTAANTQRLTLWRLLTRVMDFEDMLDDLEDTAEEIRATAASLNFVIDDDGKDDDED